MVRSGGHVEEGLGGGLDWGSGGQLDRLKVQAGEDKEVGGAGWRGIFLPLLSYPARNSQLCSVPGLHWVLLLRNHTL